MNSNSLCTENTYIFSTILREKIHNCVIQNYTMIFMIRNFYRDLNLKHSVEKICS